MKTILTTKKDFLAMMTQHLPDDFTIEVSSVIAPNLFNKSMQRLEQKWHICHPIGTDEAHQHMLVLNFTLPLSPLFTAGH